MSTQTRKVNRKSNNEVSEVEHKELDEKKTCFIITPIGEIGSKTMRSTEGIIYAAIDPALEECGYRNSEVSHKQLKSGSITREIFRSIYEADLVIANLSGNHEDCRSAQPNPNVMYELAVRHAARKRTIHICQNNQPLPFDIKDYRTIFYENDMFGVIELKEELIKMIKAVETEEDSLLSNPIYDSIEEIILKNDGSRAVDIEEMMQYIGRRMDRIESRIARSSSGYITNSSRFSNTVIQDVDRYLRSKFLSIASEIGRAPNPDEFTAYCKETSIPEYEVVSYIEKNYDHFDKSLG